MSQNLNAEVITIGTELLLGEITDTNSVHIAQVLRSIGVNLYFITTVGDNEKRIAEAVRIALDRAQIVITSGGLGPTVDDMTRQGVAAATGRQLVFHQELLDQIAARFSTFHVKMTDNNRRQAYLPDGASAIENPVGTAPCFIVEQDDRVVISLPGVPREMKFLMAENVVPYLHKRYSLGVIKARVLQTAGIGESSLDDLIGTHLLEQSNPTVGLAAHHGQVDVRITAKADNIGEAELMIDEVEMELRDRIGKYVFGIGDEKLENVLVRFMRTVGATISLAEVGIGGPIATRIQSVGEGHLCLKSIVSYPHPDDLRHALNIPADMPLRDLATTAAERYCKESGATAAVVVVSYPDVDENSDSEESTAVAVYSDTDSHSRVYGFGARSELASPWVSNWAMARLWRMLKEKFGAD